MNLAHGQYRYSSPRTLTKALEQSGFGVLEILAGARSISVGYLATHVGALRGLDSDTASRVFSTRKGSARSRFTIEASARIAAYAVEDQALRMGALGIRRLSTER